VWSNTRLCFCHVECIAKHGAIRVIGDLGVDLGDTKGTDSGVFSPAANPVP
jgi:hypothetical protein